MASATWKGGQAKLSSYMVVSLYKCWYPQIIHFNRVFHCKPSILGYHYFWKHPYKSSTPPADFWYLSTSTSEMAGHLRIYLPHYQDADSSSRKNDMFHHVSGKMDPDSKIIILLKMLIFQPAMLAYNEKSHLTQYSKNFKVPPPSSVTPIFKP